MWASQRAAASLLDCSVHPGIPVIKAFCTEVSMYPLASMKESHLCFRVEVKTFPTQDVRAMGLKFPGSSGASLAVPLGIKRITQIFQELGIKLDDQQELYRLSRVGSSEGQCFRTV